MTNEDFYQDLYSSYSVRIVTACAWVLLQVLGTLLTMVVRRLVKEDRQSTVLNYFAAHHLLQ